MISHNSQGANPDERLACALRLEQDGAPEQAANVYAAALKSHPTHAGLLDGYLGLLVGYGEFADALKYASRLVRLQPESGRARLILAQVLTSLGRSDEALQHLETASRAPRTEGIALAMLGFWHQARGGFDRSRDCFERSIAEQPSQSLAYFGWSQSRRISAESIRMLDQVEAVLAEPSLSPEDAMILLYVKGKFMAELGRYEQSMLAYDQANAEARRLNQGGRGFNRSRYSEIVDATITTFNRDRREQLAEMRESHALPIFIVGMMRSGTTLVEQILSSHPEITAGGEIEFWLDEGPKVFDADTRAVDQAGLTQAAVRYSAILKRLGGGSSRVTDKMPQNFQMLGLIHGAFPQAPIIHIRRNPIDNCLSIYTTAYEAPPDFAHDKGDIAHAYREYLRLVEHWRNTLPPDQFLEIDYEDLLANQEAITRKMVQFCGLEWSDTCLRPEDNGRVVTTPSLWQVRQPLYKSSVDRWKMYEPWIGDWLALGSNESKS